MIEDLIDGLEQGWKDALADFMRTPDGIAALDSLDTLLNVVPVNYHPSGQDIFKAFRLTPFDSVRVVIIGQDPYPDINKATGVAFSMPQNLTLLSPSIKRIYEAIEHDKAIENGNVDGRKPEHGNLDDWARQNVLLLNRVLTFRKCNRCKANIHRHMGWEAFTEAVVMALAGRERAIHFILWGIEAQKLKKHTMRGQHITHKTYHPTSHAPYVEQFRTSGYFSAVNIALGEGRINWFPPEEDLNP